VKTADRAGWWRAFPAQVTAVSLISVLASSMGSWIPSFWGDEAATLMSAQRPLPSLFRMLGHVDAVHGASYVLYHWWIHLFGMSPFVARLPAALAIGAAVPAVMLLARMLSGPSTALLSGLVYAFLPRTVYMGGQVRSYAGTAAFAVWATFVLVVIIRRYRAGDPIAVPGGRRRTIGLWTAYGALLAAGTVLFIFLSLLVIAHLIVMLVYARRRLLPWAVAVAVVGGVAAPLVLLAHQQRQQVAFLAHRTVLDAETMLVQPWFITWGVAVAGWLLILVALVGAVGAVRASRCAGSGPGLESSPSPDRPELGPGPLRSIPLEVVAGTWLFVPSLLLIGSFPWIGIYTPRYLSFCTPAAALLMGAGAVRLASWMPARRARVSLVTIGALTVAVLAPFIVIARQPHSYDEADWPQIGSVIAAHARPGDAVAFDEAVRPSRRPRLAMRTYPQDFAQVRDVTLKVPFDAGVSWHDTAYSIAGAAARGRLQSVDRLWLIEYGTPPHVSRWGRAQLAELGFVVSHRYVQHSSTIYEYQRASTG
jgi:mannosyltransferase